MQKRPKGFLGPEWINQDGEIFGYIQELHNYLWSFVRIAYPGAGGQLSGYVDDALISLNKWLDEDQNLPYKVSGSPEEPKPGALGNLTIKITADTSEFEASLAHLIETLEKVSTLRYAFIKKVLKYSLAALACFGLGVAIGQLIQAVW